MTAYDKVSLFIDMPPVAPAAARSKAVYVGLLLFNHYLFLLLLCVEVLVVAVRYKVMVQLFWILCLLLLPFFGGIVCQN